MKTRIGAVKWFDANKGFGFIADDAGGSDILLHANVLRNYGFSSVVEGTRMEVVAVETDRGLQASEISALELPRPATEVALAGLAELGISMDNIDLSKPLEPARVKWFDKAKGFGFVNTFQSSEDVFVHMEVIRAYGMSELAQGEAIRVRTAQGPRGTMAVEIRAWDYRQ